MVKQEIISNDLNVFFVDEVFKTNITKAKIFTKIFGKNMFMIVVQLNNYQKDIIRVKTG